MSEFKFACPVCGQHITADASASGSHLECPTCFQKIIVPQAPTTADPKFILSAAQVSKPRPATTHPNRMHQAWSEMSTAKKSTVVATVAFFFVLVGAGISAYAFRDKLFKTATQREAERMPTNATAKRVEPPPVVYPIPSNIVWSLQLSNAVIPDANASGAIHGSGFYCERAILQGGHLTLRQGRSSTADLGVTIQFFAQNGEDLAGKKIEVSADRQPPLPKVIVRWKDENRKAVTESLSNGYALRVIFGNAEIGRVGGKIFLSLPDDQKTVIAGTFDAELRKPPAPKAKKPPQPASKG